MLNALRKSAGSWVVKILLGLLVVSFAVWGIADIFRGYHGESVAQVGDTEVSVEAFRAAYQRELSTMANRLGRQLTPDEARTLGVDRRVLNQLLTTAALTNQARDLNLGVSDAYIAEQIVSSPLFVDAFGRFSRERYENTLRYAGYSEAAYVAEQERVEMRQQLTDSFQGDLSPPDVLIDAFHEFQGAKRVVDYIALPAIDPATIEEPGEAALKEFYSANEPQFTTPELRALNLIDLEPADLAAGIEVSEEDIAAEYESRRHEYETPERREVDQILFADADAAASAYEKISAGGDFVAVAADAGFSEKDIDLGSVTRSDIVDPKIADAAFSLAEGEISEPIAGALGTAIVRVRSVTPASVRPLSEVHDEIRDAVALDGAQDEVLDLYNEVEDSRAGGMTLAEIAQELNLTLTTVDAVDRRGRDAAGQEVTGPAANPELLRAAFDSDVGLENDAVETRSNGFIWFEVTGVTAPELKPFDSVRDDVETAWREDQARTRLRDTADGLVERGLGGEAMASLAESVDARVQTSEPFTRRSPTTPFAPSLIEAVFAAPEGTVLRGPGRNDAEQVVVRIKEMEPADALSDADRRELDQQVASALSNDIYEQYVSGLRSRDGVTVNEAALNALFGDGS